jgi:hypothetical protein
MFSVRGSAWIPSISRYRERRFPNGWCVVVASLQGRGTWRHHADGTIYGLHGRAVKAPAHHGVDAQHLFTAMLDDLVATLPAPVAEGEFPACP